MREAVGGSLLYYLIIPIILLIIFFIGFIMNYASAYRAANYIVTQIENCQGEFHDCNGINFKHDESGGIFYEIKKKYGYIPPTNVSYNSLIPCYFLSGGTNSNTYTFRVSLPVSFDLPLVGQATLMYVKAETKSITGVSSKSLALFNSKCYQ